MITVSAAVKLMPRPPARVDNKKMKLPVSSLLNLSSSQKNDYRVCRCKGRVVT